jgi:aryl carrier-like protein
LGLLNLQIYVNRIPTRPLTSQERKLAMIIASILNVNVQDVSSVSDFFGLGGDSISAITVAQQATNAGIHITARDVFHGRTVEGIVRRASDQVTNKESLPEIVVW